LPGNNQRAQKDIASLKGFGTKAGCISSIDQSGTPSFQEQPMPEDLEEAAKGVSHEKIWNSKTREHLDDYIAKRDIPDILLKDESKILQHFSSLFKSQRLKILH
jgi:hypothetical protein